MSGLALETVTIRAGGQPLLEAFDLAVPPGEIVTLMGPSGAGKSSLLAWLAGTLPAGITGEGRLTLDGQRLDHRPPEQRRLGLLLQEPLLFPHMTVAGNLVFAIPRHVKGHKVRHSKAEPRALLLDEPFTILDSELRQEIRGFVLERARTTGLPVLLVTHDQGDAEAAAGRVVQPWGPSRS
jgi:putative thiamine transport system ATP-binding protein